MKRFLFWLLSLFVIVIASATSPFEKNGKWGLINDENGKVVVKPKYNLIETVPFNVDLFIVHKAGNTVYKANVDRVGVINSAGKEIISINADSIKATESAFVVFRSRAVMFSEENGRLYPYLQLVSQDGQIITSVDGIVETTYQGGYKIHSYTFTEGERPKISTPVLYNHDLKPISSVDASIQEKGNILLIKDGSIYTALNPATFQPIVTFDWYENGNNGYQVIRKDNKYGYINLNTLELLEPSYSKFDRHSMKTGESSYQEEMVLYNRLSNKPEEALAISEAELIPGVLVPGNGGWLFQTGSADGGIKLSDDITCEEAIPLRQNSHYYSIRINGKWGVYDTYHDKYIAPLNFDNPIAELIHNNYVLINTDNGNSLYNLDGGLICNFGNSKIAGIDDGMVYIDNDWVPTGVYSISKSKWIIPIGQYSYIHRLGKLYACKVAENSYKILNQNGIVVNTLTDICGHNGGFNTIHDEFIVIHNSKNKIGLIDRNTGKTIAPSIYEDDIAWGAGEGKNRRIAISQKSDKGETVTIMTVSGKKIISKFFPYGTHPRTIKQFGRQYLYQTY